MGAPQYDGGHRTCTMGTSGMLGAPVMLGILNFLGFLGKLGKLGILGILGTLGTLGFILVYLGY